MSAHTWSGARNLLCVRLDGLGDLIMTGPAMRALRESQRGRRLTLLASPAGATAVALLSEVDEVITYEAPWMKATPMRVDSGVDHALLARLRRERFDAAVIFTVYSQNPLPAALFCYLADIPLRLAYCRENPYQLLTDWVREPEPEAGVRHEVQRHLDLVATIGCRPRHERLSVLIPPQARALVRAVLAESVAMPYVVVHPGASAPSRRYPAESFVKVADGLAEQGLSVVFTGDDAERDLIQGIQRQMRSPSVSLAGRLTLQELCALLAEAPLLVSNNTGPVHLAAAVGTPVVDLYALTNPQHTPWQVASRVLFHDVGCKYCYKSVCPAGHHDCLRQVRPEAVISAACELLAEGRRAAAGEGAA